MSLFAVVTLRKLIDANGWPFVIVFVGMSGAAVAIVVWRIIKNYRAKGNVDDFVEELEQLLQQGGPRAAYEHCEREAKESERVLAKLFYAAFRDGQQGKIAARDAMADCLDTEIMPSLLALLPHILLIVKLAPMVGLLGTVVGMINAFETIAGATKVEPSALALDIGMALFTTAEGLLIAIPLMFAYTMFRENVSRFEVELQRGAQAALRILPRIHRAAA